MKNTEKDDFMLNHMNSLTQFHLNNCDEYKTLMQKFGSVSSSYSSLFDIPFLPVRLFKSFDLIITNRWGNIVCEKLNHTGMNLWDGNDMGGNKCADGVYFYRITGEMYGGTMVNQHGFVTLVEAQ